MTEFDNISKNMTQKSMLVDVDGAVSGNATSFSTVQKNVTAAGVGENLASLAIKHGKALTIKAKSANTGNIFIGNSKANSEDSAVAFTLQSNESVSLFITNANLIWIDAAVNGEGIEYFVET